MNVLYDTSFRNYPSVRLLFPSILSIPLSSRCIIMMIYTVQNTVHPYRTHFRGKRQKKNCMKYFFRLQLIGQERIKNDAVSVCPQTDVSPNEVTGAYCAPYIMSPQMQGGTKRCRLSWLTSSALVYEPKRAGGVAGVSALSQWVQLVTWSPNKLWRSNYIFFLSSYSGPYRLSR
jgi:hypothetical protein